MEVADCVKSSPCYNHSYDHEKLYFKSEDSGYNSFSAGAIECSNDNSDSFAYVTNFRSKRRLIANVYSATFSRETPTSRRGVKRSFPEDSPNYTPTREISSKIQRLKVNETNASTSTFLIHSGQLEYTNNGTGYPTTPKKICASECKISPYKKGKRLNFNIHSLSCENLPPKIILTPESVPQKLFHLCHYENVNIIKLLLKYNVVPPLKKIFSFLSHIDINNLGLAYPKLLNEIYKLLPDIEKTQSASEISLSQVKENKCHTVEKCILKQHNINRKYLKEINNIINKNIPTTHMEEKTIQSVFFEKVDTLKETTKRQLCVQCWYPAIVVEEPSGEKWVKCTKKSCSYQFCKICKCERHPGEICSVQNDLEAPSPPKRKKVNTKDFIGTKKSKRILRRLQI